MARLFLLLVSIFISSCACHEANDVTVGKSSRNGQLNGYYHYTRDNPRDFERLYATAASASGARTMRSKTVVVVHDHRGSFNTGLNPTVKDALLTSEDVSVIVVDWSLVAAGEYDIVSGSVSQVGSGIADLIRFLVNARRFTLDNLHLVGFGLGAHVVAFTARALTGTVARITALDPSGNLWGSNSERLRANDARYVEVIHTDSKGTGTDDPIGLVDFYPNDGVTQQGCSANDTACNHDRAWQLFAATLTHEPLVGNQCIADGDPSDSNCKGFSLPMGGNQLNKFGSGRFRFQTGDKYPYQNELDCVLTCLN